MTGLEKVTDTRIISPGDRGTLLDEILFDKKRTYGTELSITASLLSNSSLGSELFANNSEADVFDL